MLTVCAERTGRQQSNTPKSPNVMCFSRCVLPEPVCVHCEGVQGGFTGSATDPELGRVSSLPHPPLPSMSVYLFRPAAHVNCIFLPERSTSGFTTSKHAGRRLIGNFMLMLTYKVIITLSAGHLNQIINHNNLVRQ